MKNPQPDDQNPFLTHLASARSEAEQRVLHLVDEAMQIAESYNKQMIALNGELHPKDLDNWAMLNASVKQSSTGRSYIYWKKYTGWITQSGKRMRSTTHLKSRNRRGGYDKATLVRNARDWEYPYAWETEQSFARIRDRLFTLYQLMDQLDEAMSGYRDDMAFDLQQAS